MSAFWKYALQLQFFLVSCFPTADMDDVCFFASIDSSAVV